MLTNAIQFLLNAILNLLTMMFLLRFIMQMLRVSFNNPIGHIVIALTDFAVKPARRFIPSWKRNDLSTLILAFLTQVLLKFSLLWLSDFPMAVANVPIWPSIFALSVVGIISAIIDIFFYALILHVILSWVNPYSSIAPILHSITRPILEPIQRLIPPIGGIDFSPMIAILLLQMLNVSVMSSLSRSIAVML